MHRTTSTGSGFASPYSTGGGGTDLEHSFGALLLAGLLQGHPVPTLGDEITPHEVRFQQAAFCPVDDLAVQGDGPAGSRTVFIGVRRSPSIGPGSTAFVRLMADYLQVVVGRRDALGRGDERLALAIAAPCVPADELEALAGIARRQPDDARFRQAVHAPRATNGKVRARLRLFDQVVTAAAATAGIELNNPTDGQEMTWRLLRSLWIAQLRLQGDSPADRTAVVARLVPLAGSAARAVALWDHLNVLSTEYAINAACVTTEMLVRDLHGFIRLDTTPGPGGLPARGEQYRQRLNDLPPSCGPGLLTAWRDQPELAWQLVTALTAIDQAPTEVVDQWQSGIPAWLIPAPWQIQAAAAQLAGAYGARQLSAQLFAKAAVQGAPHSDIWLAQAAMLHEENNDQAARATVLEDLRRDQARLGPFPRAVVAYFANDLSTASREIDSWTPVQPQEWRLQTVIKLWILARVHETVTTEFLDRSLGVLAGAQEQHWSASLAITQASLLLSRARRGDSPNFDADARQARALALHARDDMRLYRADSAQAVAVACEASILLSDFRNVIDLGTLAGSANSVEASSPTVSEYVTVAACYFGDVSLARHHAKHVTEPVARARVDGFIAKAEGRDPSPFWLRAARDSDNDEQLAQILAALAQHGTDAIDQFPDFVGRNPHQAAELRAIAKVATGSPGAAIISLRERRRSSITAALTLAHAYQAAGQLDDQVQTLRDAADHFHDPSLRLSAAEALATSSRQSEAQQEIDELLAITEPGWSRRADALRLAAHLANTAGRTDRLCELLHILLQIEPDDAPSRWALVHALLNRGDLDAAWRTLHAAPQPLDPSNTIDAQTWVHLYRRLGQPAETVAGCLRLLRRFSDDEQFCVVALTNLTVPWPESADIPAALRAEAAEEAERFFTRWPDSPHLRRIQTTDPDRLRDDMTAMLQRSNDEQLHWRRLTFMLARGQIPLSMLAAATRRSYSEICLQRAGGVLPAHNPHPDEFAACVAAAATAIDHDVVMDIPAIIVLQQLPEDIRHHTISRFARTMTTDDVMLDTLAAKDILALRSPGTFYYDDTFGGLKTTETPVEEADRLAVEAAELHSAVAGMDRRTCPPGKQFEADLGSDLRTWISPFSLARERRATLWSDDPILRALARQAGTPATSTQAILQQLLDNGVITADQREACIRRLIRSRIGAFPLDGQRLVQVARQEEWHPRSVAAAIARPESWSNLQAAVTFYLYAATRAQHQGSAAAYGWLYAAVRGATLALPRAVATQTAATLLALTLVSIRVEDDQIAALLSAIRQAISDGDDPDLAPSPDPLPLVASILREHYGSRTDPEDVIPQVIRKFAALSDADREAVLDALLR
ncbi:hypothetical protein Ait01nite_101380 [Actinoplanes italicus]|uniref:Tfp pilus assembly protein PilF n=1 Tax=Actinoplanes italicus TaxID=113567 RepID=A0A2T0J7G4_9ACTN|nr:hypothetical protein [Actinoplanes italicus]PRX03448.1 Tfp pilus assembly protein PilF [Actinoplanes italicus]GIE37093.1 hypothetical protein Ait01nite_101380 [Actinoplanes italicus]